MKRLLVVVSVLFPLSLFIAGCGGTGGPSGKSSGMPSADEKQRMQDMMKAGKAKTTGQGQAGAKPVGAPTK